MRRRRVIGPLMAICLVATATLAAPASAQTEAAVPDESWIVTLAPNSNSQAVAPALVSQAGGSSLDGVFSRVLNGFSFRGSEQAAARLGEHPLVVSVNRDGGLRIAEDVPAGVARIGADDTALAGYTGVTEEGVAVRVAVLDSGIQATHPDLADNVATGEGKNCITPGGAPDDDNGHGTHVAGSVAAAQNGIGVVGVAPGASIVPVKVVDATGYGTDSQVICGLEHVAALAADGVPTVVNMSLGERRTEGTGCASAPLHQAICSLVDMGVVVVAAAGNDGATVSDFYPAAYPETIAVSAFTDLNGQGGASSGCGFFDILNACDEMLGWFSNYGPEIDVAAPGVNVQSTTNDGGWGTKSGTSMAAPHVAGVAALMLGANPGLTPDRVRTIMRETGECPDGAVALAPTCSGHGQWSVGGLFGGSSPDPDGIAEPLVDALGAVQKAVALAGPDVVAPVVSLVGADLVWLGVGEVWVDPGATAFDFVDGDLSDEIVVDGVVDTAVAGTYPVTYNVSDAAGNAAVEVVRTVVVEDTPPPDATLRFTADNAVEVFVNGASVGSSSQWSELSTVVSRVHVGDVIAVHASDAGGVAGFLAHIDWDGLTLVSNSSWKVATSAPEGWDTVGFDDSGWADATGHGAYGVAPWNTGVNGFPTDSAAQWIWSDDNDGDDEVFLRLVVPDPDVDDTAPVITLNGPDPQYMTVGDDYTEQGASALDDRDGDITDAIVTDTSTLDTTTPGTYQVTYNVSDAAGNAAVEMVRTVIVRQATPATMIFTADNAVEAFVNGTSVGSSSNWKQGTTVNIDLAPGDVIAINATDAGGIAGFLAQLTRGSDTIVSDATWKVTTTAPPGWQLPTYDDSTWDTATTYGPYGIAPWHTNVTGFPTNSTAQWIWTNDNNNDNNIQLRYTIPQDPPDPG